MLQQRWDLLTSRWGFFSTLIHEHLGISFAAVAIALVFGGLFGILIAERPRASKPTLAVVNFLYTIPSISMLGFLIPFSGVGNATAVIALTIYALLPMVRNTYTGLANVDPAIVEAARGMGSTDVQILRRIKLPLAAPVIMAGVRSMVTMTIALAGIASFIGAGGLGVAIYRGITTNNAAMTLVGSLLIAVMALVADLSLGMVERHLVERTSGSRHGSRRRTPGGEAAPSRGPVIVRRTLIGVGIVAAAALVVRAARSVAGVSSAGTLHVATKPMTEQYVMGFVLKDLIESRTALSVELTEGVGGGTSNIQPAMLAGEFDLYPEYTGTAWNVVLGRQDVYSEDRFDELLSSYENDLGLTWRGMYGFNDTYAILVQADVAREHGLRTYSDLASVADGLSFGANYDFFEIAGGFTDLCEAYGMTFGSTMDLDIGLKYQAFGEHQVDALLVFTTDGQLTTSDGVVLEDDRGFFPSYRCGNVVRRQVLDEHPELEGALGLLNSTITDAQMASMNHAVETDGREPEDVAHGFLVERGLLDG